MKDRETLYHLIDWGLAIIALPFLQSYSFFIFSAAALISMVLILFFRNKRLKNQLDSYKLLFDFPVPLYGVLAYLNRQSKRPESYRNDKIHLKELSLCVQLVGNIQQDKSNDLRFLWSFFGRNTSKTDVGELYLNIGGDNAQKLSDLNIQCVDCSVEQDSCTHGNKLYACNINAICAKKQLLTPHPVNITKGLSAESNTSYLLNFPLAKKVAPHDDIKVKCEYTWPQCYNKYSDYLHIDPCNFAGDIEQIRIRIMLDGKVIKAKTKVQIYSVDKTSNIIEPESLVPIDDVHFVVS